MIEEKEIEFTLEDAMNNFVIPNCVLQVTEECQKKGGVSIPFLSSPPGAGKTTIQYEKYEQLGWGLLTIQPALKPIEEYSGIPKFQYINVKEEKILGTVWSIPEVLIELHRLSSQKKIVVFFWDDIHLCGPEHLALMQECFTERSIRGYKLPANVAIVLAGNPSQKAGFRSLSSAIINRCVKLPVYSSFVDWKKNFAVKKDIHSSIISFLGHAMYSKYFHEAEKIDDPWASPRQWTRLSNFITAYEEYFDHEQRMPINQLLYYSSGHVGKEAASQYVRYFEIFSKFDMNAIFENSDTFEPPKEEYDKYIFVFAALNYIVGKYKKTTKEKLHKQIVNIVGKLFETDESMAILLLKELILIDKSSTKVKIDSPKIIEQIESKYNGILNKVLDERTADDD